MFTAEHFKVGTYVYLTIEGKKGVQSAYGTVEKIGEHHICLSSPRCYDMIPYSWILTIAEE